MRRRLYFSAMAVAMGLSSCGNGSGDTDSCGGGPACESGAVCSNDRCRHLCSVNTDCAADELCGGTLCERRQTGECGDGTLNMGEQCDDGNDVEEDQCSTQCETAVCGDAIVQTGETCDDGNNDDTDACTNGCRSSNCGNGVVEPPEQCDDGNVIAQDSCTNACTDPICGDGILQAGEYCDDNNSVDTDTCPNDCSNRCGNGLPDTGEECDDGNDIDTDTCTNDCSANCEEGFRLAGLECIPDDGCISDGLCTCAAPPLCPTATGDVRNTYCLVNSSIQGNVILAECSTGPALTACVGTDSCGVACQGQLTCVDDATWTCGSQPATDESCIADFGAQAVGGECICD